MCYVTVREGGAVPATVAVLGGRVCVGLADEQLAGLADQARPAVKTSRRDFPYVIANKVKAFCFN